MHKITSSKLYSKNKNNTTDQQILSIVRFYNQYEYAHIKQTKTAKRSISLLKQHFIGIMIISFVLSS